MKQLFVLRLKYFYTLDNLCSDYVLHRANKMISATYRSPRMYSIGTQQVVINVIQLESYTLVVKPSYCMWMCSLIKKGA